MSGINQAKDPIYPSHVVLACVMGVTLAGACLLTNGPLATLEGAKDWREESPLRAIVHVLNLGYTQTTAQGIEIKWLVFGLGTSAALLTVGVALMIRPPYDLQPIAKSGADGFGAGELSHCAGELSLGEWPTETRAVGDSTGRPPASMPGSFVNRQINPLTAAQVLMALYVLWSFASVFWSSSPDLALGGSILLAMGVAWALVLGRGLPRSVAAAGMWIVVGVCVVTSVLAIVYHDERNPTRRAQYPLGNPLFLAATLLPALILSVAMIGGTIAGLAGRVTRRRAGWRIPLLIVVFGTVAWAIQMTGSRGAVVAGVAGFAGLVFFHLRGWRRVVFATVGVIAAILVLRLVILPQTTTPSATGRDASLRVRAYAWSYAISLIDQSKWIGHGQGGFTQYGDALAIDDVLDDPQALSDRIAHAHNEWLEVWADLGVVGISLVVGALVLTVVGGVKQAARLNDPSARWSLLGVLAVVVALIVEESSDVALRIAGFPTMFYTVLGLSWSLSREPSASVALRGDGAVWKRRVAGCGLLLAAGALFVAAMGDFQSSRAFFKVGPALEQGDYGAARRFAETSVRWRLSPQRRLESYERLCSTHLYLAREYQTSSLNRFSGAMGVDPPNERLLMLAEEDRRKCEDEISGGQNACKSLIRRCPGYRGSGWLEMRLWQLRAAYAAVDGLADQEASYLDEASRALERELKRRPFDSVIALSYVELAGEKLGTDARFEVLSRPLRYSLIPRTYAEFAVRGPTGEFVSRLTDILNGDSALPADEPYLPEKLRLAAHISFARMDLENPVRLAELALNAYDQIGVSHGLGLGAAHAELAEYRFQRDPADWKECVELALRGIARLPDSTPGRMARQAIEDHILTYRLAGGDEESVRTEMQGHGTSPGDFHLASSMGDRYARLALQMMRRGELSLPAGFDRWVERARELSPRNELAWRLTAQAAYNQGRLDECVVALRRALEFGAAADVIYGFVQLALADHPTQSAFVAIEQELRSVIEAAQAPSSLSSPRSSIVIETDPTADPQQ